MHLSWQQNLGTIDRMLRIVVGLAFIYLAAFQSLSMSGFFTGLLWILGAFLFIEALLGY